MFKLIFQRTLEIWRPNFLANLISTQSQKATWLFWFFWNTIIAIVATGLVTVGVIALMDEGEQYLVDNFPAAAIGVTGGRFFTEGIPDPYYYEAPDESMVIAIDTTGQVYDPSVLDDFERGFFFDSEKMYGKKSRFETREIDFTQTKENFRLTTNDVINWLDEYGFRIKLVIGIFFFVIFWLVFSVFRLVSALWWTLWFWVAGLIFKIGGLTFSKTYFSVLNFYLIPLVIVQLLSLFDITVPFLTFTVLAVMFGINFWHIKKSINGDGAGTSVTPPTLGESQASAQVTAPPAPIPPATPPTPESQPTGVENAEK